MGDSRLYLLRDGVLRRITRDQTRAEFRRRDGLPVSEADHSALAQSFIYGSRGQGDPTKLRFESGLDSGTIGVRPGDRLLLCSDGVCGAVHDEALGKLLGGGSEPQRIAEALGRAALDNGGMDNLTAVVVFVGTSLDFGHLLAVDVEDESDDDTYTF